MDPSIDKALRKDIEYAVCSGVFSVRYYKLLGFEKYTYALENKRRFLELGYTFEKEEITLDDKKDELIIISW